MCEFFSFINDGKGKVYYFSAKQRKNLLGHYPDSHTSIATYYLDGATADDKVNKWEYIKGQLYCNQLNTIDDTEQVKKWIKQFTRTREFENICIEAVKKDGNNLIYIAEQTPKICLEAVKQDGLALKYVREQTPEICLKAVKQNKKHYIISEINT